LSYTGNYSKNAVLNQKRTFNSTQLVLKGTQKKQKTDTKLTPTFLENIYSEKTTQTPKKMSNPT
jgi:hypothetical protein